MIGRTNLDSLPGGTELDKNALLGDALLLIKSNQLLGLVDLALLVEGKSKKLALLTNCPSIMELHCIPCVDLSGDSSWDNLENFASKQDKELVHGRLHLVVQGSTLGLAKRDGLK